jgi:hypothetical protein
MSRPKTIWKYLLKMTEFQTIDMPMDAKILSVQVQNEHPCVWAMVEPEQPKRPRNFVIQGTGLPIEIDAHLDFIGTFQLHGGSLVFHLFEVKA